MRFAAIRSYSRRGLLLATLGAFLSACTHWSEVHDPGDYLANGPRNHLRVVTADSTVYPLDDVQILGDSVVGYRYEDPVGERVALPESSVQGFQKHGVSAGRTIGLGLGLGAAAFAAMGIAFMATYDGL